MKQEYNFLIIDDHPLIAEAYKSALQFIKNKNKNLIFNIDFANNCEVAFDKIHQIPEDADNSIVFLDIRLPPSETNKMLSGEDLGIKIRERIPKAKIIISTTFNDNYRIHSIFRSINPEGFLIKNDITPQELVVGIETIMEDPPYYSKTVTKLLRKKISQEFILDNIDRELLYELSIGTKMKDLPNIIPLSIAGVERRKRHLKEVFDIREKGDRALVLAAKEKGFI